MKYECYLATTAQDYLWQTDEKIVFLGDWCLLHTRRSLWKGIDGQVMINCFSEDESSHEAYGYVREVYESVLPQLAEVLNSVHGTDFSLRYWRILLGPWLQSYLTATYDRYRHIEHALSEFPRLTTTVLSEDSFETPSDTLSYVTNLFEDSFNLQIYSKIFRFFGKDFPKVSINCQESSLYNKLARISWKHKAVNAFSKLYMRVLSKYSSVVFRSTYFPFSSEIAFLRVFMGRVALMKVKSESKVGVEYNSNIRENIKKVSFGEDDFLKCLSEMLFADIPKCFVEDYQAIGKEGVRGYPNSAKVIFSANSWYYDEVFKSWSAKRAEKGALLLGTPHGGGYGAEFDIFGEEHEVSIVDYYYSWGWSKEGHAAKVIPMPASKLMNIEECGASNVKEGILWVATVGPRYLIEFNDVPRLFPAYMSWQKRFLEAVPHVLLSEVLLRAHYQDNGWGLVSRLKEVEPSLKVDSWSVPFRKRLDQCRLYVCDHLSTTFIEALAANKPTILFWDPDANKLRSEAEPYFELLRKVGVLFDNPESASEAVSHAYADVELWWNDDRQKAVKEFCSQFARTSPDAIKLWEEEIRRVILESEKRRI